ncbi:hypothetical protein DZ860_14160 [Vibrio sinensis]|uniref:Uncharacterized protein n=1 Tax=Vibrio sinensis TaxID=2302434 RepID=A0A3A6QDN9_9VIBR|nr:hypothetical protein [Vibrio sinensis]RJX70028.1 hypothetical protein DZ860_14160 [Vibrio sinensis]
MQDQGLAHFESVEDFKRAFLPTHQACVEAGKNLATSEEKIKTNAAIVEKLYEELDGCLDDINDYFRIHRNTLDASLEKLTSSEGPSNTLDKERKASKAFSQVLQEGKLLITLSNQVPLDEHIDVQLDKNFRQLCTDVHETLDILSNIRQAEDEYFARCKVLGDEKRAEEKRKIEAQLRLDAEAQVVADRRQSLKKKLLCTGVFIFAVAGFIMSQMA